eukprot:scaffold229023_cov24-Prasinocladus_malaysianus.AAC.1
MVFVVEAEGMQNYSSLITMYEDHFTSIHDLLCGDGVVLFCGVWLIMAEICIPSLPAGADTLQDTIHCRVRTSHDNSMLLGQPDFVHEPGISHVGLARVGVITRARWMKKGHWITVFFLIVHAVAAGWRTCSARYNATFLRSS